MNPNPEMQTYADLVNAKAYMAKALVAASKLNYREAIEHYEQAWRRARKAAGVLDSESKAQCKLEADTCAVCETNYPDTCPCDSDDDDDDDH